MDVLQNGEFIAANNYSRLFSNAPSPIAILKGREMRYVFVNESYANIFPERAILGKTLEEAFPELQGAPFLNILRDVFDSGIPFNGSEMPAVVAQNEDGTPSTRYFNLVYTPYTGIDGNIEGVMAFGSDVTAQVESRRRTEFAEERARLAIESADLGTYEINLVTDEMIVAPRFNEIWGFTHHTADRSEFAAVIHPDDLAVRARAHQRSLETGNLEYEARILRKDGTTKWVKVKGKVIYDEQQRPQRLLGVIQDITEQILFEEELAKQVQERTQELKDANEQLHRSNRELEQFAYIASHDLQEPLRKIQLFNNVLGDQSDLSPKSRNYIEKVNESATRMAGLIHDLLEYSRLSKESRFFERTDLNMVLKNVLIDFEVLISQQNANVVAGKLPEIEALPIQMNQLFYNLIGNSLKFAKKEVVPEILITCEKLSAVQKGQFLQLQQEKDYIMISMTDNGIGFQQEYADRIFTIFQRLNEKSRYEGYGIGLALCRKIIDNHCGIIYAEGNPKMGSTFRFILPTTQ